eukprot:snap_masked-scaffold_33-processed-gene-1.28-mRNA-1 protein AED:1.00 eAED:1.00 QI:0/-1/0/0/-1/1/1/0/104
MSLSFLEKPKRRKRKRTRTKFLETKQTCGFAPSMVKEPVKYEKRSKLAVDLISALKEDFNVKPSQKKKPKYNFAKTKKRSNQFQAFAEEQAETPKVSGFHPSLV